jgi:DNA-binding NarL/FixJ family response regulator
MDATLNRTERLSVLDRGYAVTQVNTRNESLSTVADPRWDPIIIDLGPRPSRDLSLIQSIRRHSHAPLLVLSGRNGVNRRSRHSISGPTTMSAGRSPSRKCWDACAQLPAAAERLGAPPSPPSAMCRSTWRRRRQF